MVETLLIRDALIWVGDGFSEVNIYVEDGVIKSISKKKVKADTVLNAYHQPVIPGGIDIHAHIYDPAYLDNEDWRTGSLAAAYGGLTTVYDMPLRTFVDNREIVRKKVEAGRRDSYINFGIIAGFMNKDNMDRVGELAEEGVRGYKVFTVSPYKPSDRDYSFIFERISSVNGVAIIHAEDDTLVAYGEYRFREYSDPETYHEHRTPYAEASAIIRMGYIGLEVGTHLHIAHLSSGEGVEAVKYIKNKTRRISVETCPHYLYFTREDVGRHGVYLKVAPTLKTSRDRDQLWIALDHGYIDVYASDNAPAPRELKEKDIWSAWGGIPNLEIMIPFLYTYGVRQRRISFTRFLELTSRNPAKIMGIYPRKGEICIGCDADLVVLETRKTYKYRADQHHHKVDWSPWEGIEFYGKPLHVIVNGKPLIMEEELVGKPGTGEYIKWRPRKGEII